MIFNKEDLSLITISQTRFTSPSQQVFCMNFLNKCLSHHWTDWLQNLIPPDQQTFETSWCCEVLLAQSRYYWKSFILLKQHDGLRSQDRLTWLPHEQFLEYPEKLISRDGNDVIGVIPREWGSSYMLENSLNCSCKFERWHNFLSCR